MIHKAIQASFDLSRKRNPRKELVFTMKEKIRLIQ